MPLDISFSQTEVNQLLIAAVVAVMGLIVWWIKGFMRNINSIRRNDHRNEVRLGNIEKHQEEVQRDINLILEILLKRELTTERIARRRPKEQL